MTPTNPQTRLVLTRDEVLALLQAMGAVCQVVLDDGAVQGAEGRATLIRQAGQILRGGFDVGSGFHGGVG